MAETESTTSYTSIKPFITDLDLIFFKGTEFVSRTIMELERMWLGDGDWSHVGIVISKKHLSSLNTSDPPETLYVWESTMSSTNKLITSDPIVDAESNTGIFGVQIRRLDDVLKEAFKQGEGAGWSKLINNPLQQKPNEVDINYAIRKEHILKRLNQLHIKYYHKSYPLNILRISRGLFMCLTCIKPLGKNKAVFCSQFVAIVYETLGIIDKSFDPGEIVLEDLADKIILERHFDLLSGIISTPINFTSM